MNKISTAVVIVATVMFASCGGNDSPEIDKSIMPAADSNTTVPASTNAGNITGMPADQQAPPGVVTAVPDPQVQQNAKTIPAGDAAKAMPAAGLNPAHGQPGHRCDISVGAPLNSAPTTATKPQVQPATTAPQIISTPTPAPTPAATPANPNAKLNPAHGQPGHDCSIAVGAPLKNG